MSNLKDKIRRDEPGNCTQCGQPEAWHVYTDLCQYCVAMNFLAFRHAMGWPLDDLARRNIGFPEGTK
jgi:hypothetical protein